MEITVFTDGSCLKSKRGIYAGYGVYFPNGEISNISKPFLKKPITNQRAELYAIKIALEYITELLDFSFINIYTDSEYSIKSLTQWIFKWEKNGWKTAAKKPVKNLDLIKPIYQIIKKYKGRINFIHVRSHTGKKDYLSVGNSEADELAVAGAKLSSKIKYRDKMKK